jgi:Protein of unknown function (DUF2948)
MPDLRLLAIDIEDLEVISAYVQDAIVRVEDMGFSRSDRRFALLMNRYAWEEGHERSRKGQRKRTALHFDYVDGAEASGIDLKAREGVLELLSVSFKFSDAPAGEVILSFAGGGTVRLTVECLEARMRDLGAAWAAKAAPAHALEN